LDAALQWLRSGPDRHVLTLGDPHYPAPLLNTADPPLLLYLQGRPEALQQVGLAIVGSRNATPQGLGNARAFASHMAEQGWMVISGLAAGIDTAAHEGALSARMQGPAEGHLLTMAVVGTGLDRVYPPRNRELAARIALQGALLSEYPPGTPALPEHFPQRNRIIAGLSRGTLVVEAALQSGSLITARLASEAGREVFAVPGSIHAPHSKGCHALIRQGAKLVETAQDILEEFSPSQPGVQRFLFQEPAPVVATPAPHAEQALLDALGHDPVTTDALGARTGWSAAALAAKLLELELQGLVARLPGGLYQRHMAG
jgi:DNA processing protein